MPPRRAWLVALLVVYVALDLSLASMPGAFVFDPADSVETVQTRADRGREIVTPLALATPLDSTRPATISLDPLSSRRAVRPVPHARIDHSPRNGLVSASSDEDPH